LYRYLGTFLNIKYANGIALREWQSGVSSCIVARKDKRPLSEEHLEAIWMYIDQLLNTFGEDGPEAAHKEITRDSFKDLFKDYKDNEAENGRKN
jgi:hypothetical protein